MEKLKETIEVRGTGIPGLTATLIKRTGKKAIYQRSDGVYEVFRIKILPAGKILTKSYPERETYPGNEDFGKWAWCWPENFRDEAIQRYDKI